MEVEVREWGMAICLNMDRGAAGAAERSHKLPHALELFHSSYCA